MSTRLTNIAKLVVMGWAMESGVRILEPQQGILIEAVAKTLQSIQDEERKGFQEMLIGGIDTCKQHDMTEGANVLQAVLEAEQESSIT